MFGTARDAVDLFEEIQGVPMADSSYRDAIARYAYYYLDQEGHALRYFEKALELHPGDDPTQA